MDLGGSLASIPSRLSSLVPRMVILRRMAEVWRMTSGPDCGSAARSATMEATSSARRAASPYSRTHGSADDAIAGREMDPIGSSGAAERGRAGDRWDGRPARLLRFGRVAGCLLDLLRDGDAFFPLPHFWPLACDLWLVVSSPGL